MKKILLLIIILSTFSGCISLNVPKHYFRITNKMESNIMYYTMEGTKYENKEGIIPVENTGDIERRESEGSFILKIYSDKTKKTLIYSSDKEPDFEESVEFGEDIIIKFEMTEDKIIKKAIKKEWNMLIFHYNEKTEGELIKWKAKYWFYCLF